MCNNQSLPPKGYAQSLLRNLAVVNDPNADVHPDNDIETATRNNLPISNDLIARETQEVGEIAHGMNVLQISGILVDRGVRHSMDYEYDEIFSYIARRAGRPSGKPRDLHRAFMSQWRENVYSRRSDRQLALEDIGTELGYLGFIPRASKIFISMVRDCLPAKLDFSSWVGEVVKRKLVRDAGATPKAGKFIMWQDSMGQAFATRVQKEQARLDQRMSFVGAVGGDGRLVWREDASGVHTSIRPDIEERIKEAEQTLVSLSIQIANWLAWCVFKYHAEPMARMRNQTAFTSGEIIQAVIEILGDAWFELPFDDEDLLKQWKFERAFPCDLEVYLNVVDDHQDVRDEIDDQINEDEDDGSGYGSSNYLSDEDDL